MYDQLRKWSIARATEGRIAILEEDDEAAYDILVAVQNVNVCCSVDRRPWRKLSELINRNSLVAYDMIAHKNSYCVLSLLFRSERSQASHWLSKRYPSAWVKDEIDEQLIDFAIVRGFGRQLGTWWNFSVQSKASGHVGSKVIVKTLKDESTRAECLSFLDAIAEKNKEDGQIFTYLSLLSEVEPLLSDSFKKWVRRAPATI